MLTNLVKGKIMKAIIIEDEQFAYEKLVMMLSKADDSIDIVGHAKSIESAVELIRKSPHIDLAFFDIQLADGLSFSIFDQLEVSFPVIFTTAYDHHAIRAFKHHSIDYLLKPIRLADLSVALDKYHSIWKPAKNENDKFLDEVKQSSHNTNKERFTVKVGEHIKMIKTADVSCFYSFEKGTFIHTSDGRNYLIDYSLDELSDLLSPTLFYRVNRKYIINLDFIRDMISYSNSRLKIILEPATESEVVVSRERVRDFKNWIDR